MYQLVQVKQNEKKTKKSRSSRVLTTLDTPSHGHLATRLLVFYARFQRRWPAPKLAGDGKLDASVRNDPPNTALSPRWGGMLPTPPRPVPGACGATGGGIIHSTFGGGVGGSQLGVARRNSGEFPAEEVLVARNADPERRLTVDMPPSAR